MHTLKIKNAAFVGDFAETKIGDSIFKMVDKVFQGILLPFIGTSLGASCVFFMKKTINSAVQRALTGFASGVMVAATIWSLLIPAMEQAADLGRWSFFPAVAGFWIGLGFLILLDHMTLCFQIKGEKRKEDGVRRRTYRMLLAIMLHNIPDGMAVGVIYAGWMTGNSEIAMMEAIVFSLGVAIRNIPEGAIVSMPLCAAGAGRKKAFVYGVLSGIVEPIGAALTILAAGIVLPILPYLLGFAAGAMLCIVVKELIPEMSKGVCSNIGTVVFAVGFSLMIVLNAALG